MNKIFIIFISLFLLSSCSFNQGITSEKLSQTSTSWDGSKFHYPKGKEEITSVRIKIGPGEKIPFHCHPVPTMGYVVSGNLEVEKMNGQKKKFKTGDDIIEVSNIWHRGHNLSKIREVSLIVFYAGKKSVANTIMYNDKNRNKCKK